MNKEGNLRPSSSMIGSSILFVPKANGSGLCSCIDYSHLNDYMKKDRTLLPTTEELSAQVQRAKHITKVNLKSGFYLIRMALGHEKYTALHIKFALFKYMVMPFGLRNTPATLQREIHRILRPLSGLELVINPEIYPDEDERMVAAAYIDDKLIATRESLDKHHRQVSKVFQLQMDNNICIEIDKCVFDVSKTRFVGFMVSNMGL